MRDKEKTLRKKKTSKQKKENGIGSDSKKQQVFVFEVNGRDYAVKLYVPIASHICRNGVTNAFIVVGGVLCTRCL